MHNARACYFSVVHTGESAPRVRFGFSRRPDAQIEVSDESWKHIAARLRYEGFQFVELTSDKTLYMHPTKPPPEPAASQRTEDRAAPGGANENS